MFLILFQVDGILFFKKDTPYVSEESDEVLWLKPYMLPDVFDGVSVPKPMMSQKPSSYTDFPSFVDDVKNGRIKNKKNKKKVKAFVPNIKLKLPPPQERHISQGGKKNKGKPQGSGWGGGQSEAVNRGGGVGRPYAGGDNYAKLLAGSGRQVGASSPYGKGAVTGYPYYGDEHDYYFPNEGYGAGRPRRSQDPFRMGDMQSALGYYDYGYGRARGRGKTQQQRYYELF